MARSRLSTIHGKTSLSLTPLNLLTMSFLSSLHNFFSPAAQQRIDTPYGQLNLAKEADRTKLRKMVVDIQRATDSLTRRDIADWRRAHQMAISVDAPNRIRLYDIYNDTALDLHLSGCVEQRIGLAMARSFKLMKPDGTYDEQSAKLFDMPWFKTFCRLTLETVYWGHSLIELGNVVANEAGVFMYDSVAVVPRKHVIPEYGKIVKELGSDIQKGVDYRTPPLSEWLIEVGQPYDLGLYLKACIQTIPKKNALGFWDNFAEIFGMPMRIAKTNSRDDRDRAKLEKMMSQMGAALWGVFQEGTEIEVVESTKGDAFNVYDRRIDRANSELSKLIIGQTMTIEDGSSLSQSETHMEVLHNLVERDCDNLRDVINTQLLPRMVKHGFPVQGLSFEWDYSIDYTPEQQLAIEQLVVANYEVEGKYFEKKYGIPAGERRSMMGQSEPSEQPETSESSKKKAQHAFFD